MQMIHTNALLRALNTCAKIFRQAPRKEAIEGTALPPLTAHIARDIGLNPSELEQMRHRWPSQSTRHPYL